MQKLLERLQKRETPIAVVGLGYVGLPLAVHMAKKYDVIGFDIKQARIQELCDGHDSTGEVEDPELQASSVRFSADPSILAETALIIVAVPTPIDDARNPDLRPMIAASRTVGEHMTAGSVVVYESTVYPGATEEVCLPELERLSGLTCGKDFWIGYSPERINPGDKEHSFDRITKVVAGQNDAVLDMLCEVYGSVVTAGIHRAATIKTAEAAKVIENTQRDLNIALMNELAMIFNSLDIDTTAVLEAAGTKWNFLPFRPGLVGGHCIGVDPYYLTYQARRLGYHPRVILGGRQINDMMPKFVAEQTVKKMARAGLPIQGAKVLVLGLTFKEDVPDLRNSKVIDVIKELREYSMDILLHDPLASAEELDEEYGETMTDLHDDLEVEAIVYAVKHKKYAEMGLEKLARFARKGALLVDVKSACSPEDVAALGLHYWRL